MTEPAEEEKNYSSAMEQLRAYKRSRDKQDRVLEQNSRKKIEIGNKMVTKFDHHVKSGEFERQLDYKLANDPPEKNVQPDHEEFYESLKPKEVPEDSDSDSDSCSSEEKDKMSDLSESVSLSKLSANLSAQSRPKLPFNGKNSDEHSQSVQNIEADLRELDKQEESSQKNRKKTNSSDNLNGIAEAVTK